MPRLRPASLLISSLIGLLLAGSLSFAQNVGEGTSPTGSTQGTAGNGALGQGGLAPQVQSGGSPAAAGEGIGESLPEFPGLSGGSSSSGDNGGGSNAGTGASSADLLRLFQHGLSQEERNYFLRRQDEGDFEMLIAGEHTGSFNFTGYRESSTQMLDFVIGEAKTGFVDHVRLGLFVAFLFGDPSQSQPSVTFFEPDGAGGTVTHPEPVSLMDNVLLVGAYKFRLAGNKVISAQAPGQAEVTFAADAFDLPPTIDRVLPDARMSR